MDDSQYSQSSPPSAAPTAAAATSADQPKSSRRGRKIQRTSSIMKTAEHQLSENASRRNSITSTDETPPAMSPPSVSATARSGPSPVLESLDCAITTQCPSPVSLLAEFPPAFEYPAAIDVPLFAALANASLSPPALARGALASAGSSSYRHTVMTGASDWMAAAAEAAAPSSAWPQSTISTDVPQFGLQPPYLSSRERTMSLASTTTTLSTSTSSSGPSSAASSTCGPSTPDTFSPTVAPINLFASEFAPSDLCESKIPSTNTAVLNKLDALWASFSKLDDSLDLFAVPASAHRLAIVPNKPEVDDLAPWIDLSQVVSTSTWMNSMNETADISDLFGLA
ncbi:hypothetical protein ACM66B_005375 [Microbotryomycetes sp. NB124-2]